MLLSIPESKFFLTSIYPQSLSFNPLITTVVLYYLIALYSLIFHLNVVLLIDLVDHH